MEITAPSISALKMRPRCLAAAIQPSALWEDHFQRLVRLGIDVFLWPQHVYRNREHGHSRGPRAVLRILTWWVVARPSCAEVEVFPTPRRSVNGPAWMGTRLKNRGSGHAGVMDGAAKITWLGPPV